MQSKRTTYFIHGFTIKHCLMTLSQKRPHPVHQMETYHILSLTKFNKAQHNTLQSNAMKSGNTTNLYHPLEKYHPVEYTGIVKAHSGDWLFNSLQSLNEKIIKF